MDLAEDNRRHVLYFRINDHDPVPVIDLTTSEYVKLKHNDQLAHDYVRKLIQDKQVYFGGDDIEVLYRSTDDVDYKLVESRPRTTPTTGSASTSVVKVGLPSTSIFHPTEKHTPSETTATDSRSSTEKPIKQGADNYTSRLSSQQLKSKPSEIQAKQPSQVWKHFEKESNVTARCKFCNKVFKHGGNTTNLFQHLNRKHSLLCPPIEGNQRKNFRSSGSSDDSIDDPPPSKRIKFPSRNKPLGRIDEAFERVNSYIDGGKTADKITNAILYMIAVDEMPLSTVENKGFRSFAKTVVPLYQVPSRRSITKLIDAKYELLKQRYKDAIQEVNSYSLTCDNWTDVANQSYLGVSLHYLSKDLEMKNNCIGVFPLYNNHTSNYLAEAFNSVIKDFNLDITKIRAVVSDSAPNIRKAVTDIVGKDRQLACFSHIVSHLVSDALITMPEAKVLITKVRNVTTIIRRSVVASDELKRLQLRDGKTEGTVLKFIQDVVTRWNSTLDMLERYLTLEEYVYPVILKCANPPDMLMREEVNVLKELVALMEPVRYVITELSGDSYPTCSIVIPIIRCMKAAIDDIEPQSEIGINFKKNLLSAIDIRFKDFEFNPVLSVATILDPRFKKMHFENASAAAAAITRICNNIQQNILRRPLHNTGQPASDCGSRVKGVWGFHDYLIAKYPEKSTHNEAPSLEIRQYLTQPVIARLDNPFIYWESIKHSFPLLYHLAMQYISIVGTSVASERMFSQAGHIKSDRRSRLTGERLNRLLFLSSLTQPEWEMG